MTRFEAHFDTMGCSAGVWLAADRPLTELERMAAWVRTDVEDVATRLTRFDAGSELCRLNDDPREVVPASPVLRRFVLAARWAGVATDGLVDVTRLRALEAAGYATSRAGAEPAPLAAALADGPTRRPAGAHPDHAYTTLQVAQHGVRRPPGVLLDSGGVGKGLAADLAAERLPSDVTFAIAIGGDLAVGGPASQPVDVRRAAPAPAPAPASTWRHTGPPTPVRRRRTAETGADVIHTLGVTRGGVATSGIHQRLWRDADGAPAHHLIDPATGRPAWTGLVAVTAVGADAVEAEVLAKAALLAGPLGARRRLRRHGGVLQHDDGCVEVLAAAPVVRLSRTAVAA